MIVLYKTTNKINKKFYIGVHKTKNPQDFYYGSGVNLKKDIKQFGKENFEKEILIVFDDEEEDKAYLLESLIVNKNFILRDDVYNKSVGGKHGPIMYGPNNPFYGKTHSKNTLEKIKNSRGSNWRKPYTEEERKRYSEFFKNLWNNHELKTKMIQHRTGSKRTEETKKKMSEKRLGFKLTNETKQKISVIVKTRWKENSEQFKRSQESLENARNKLKKVDHYWQDKVNKNPEKIRKTAEKHRGMKRTEETKKRISESKKGKEGFFKNKFCVYNPHSLERLWLNEGDEIPPNFIKGTGLKRKRRKQSE